MCLPPLLRENVCMTFLKIMYFDYIDLPQINLHLFIHSTSLPFLHPLFHTNHGVEFVLPKYSWLPQRLVDLPNVDLPLPLQHLSNAISQGWDFVLTSHSMLGFCLAHSVTGAVSSYVQLPIQKIVALSSTPPLTLTIALPLFQVVP